MKKSKQEISGGAMCGGLISASMNRENMKKYGIWADVMAFVLPDVQYEEYLVLKRAGKNKEAKKIIDRFAVSQI